MTHPEPSDNPHAEAFPGLSVDASGNVLTGHDADGNPVILHVTNAYGRVGAPDDHEDEGSEEPSASQTEQDGTARSTSSGTAGKSAKSGGTPSRKPAPTTEPPSKQAPTTASTAPSATGDGTAQPTGPSRPSKQADKS